jgi:hypothetical protein
MRMRTLAAAAATAVAAATVTAGMATAQNGLHLSDVPTANPKAPGLTAPNRLSAELMEVARAQGSTTVENPRDGVGYYGYDSVDNDPTLMPTTAAGSTTPAEAHKSEPDKNTYLVLKGQKGPDTGYDYGTHFLFQGHESGKPGYVTRVNLDADAAHRVTVMATKDADGNALPDFDGSTWDPFAKKLLFTAEAGCKGGVWQGDPTYSPDGALEDVSGALGRGGYEGVQTASDGSIWLVEDVGGAKAGDNGKAKAANSYVYRFVPEKKNDLTQGRLQALQVLRADGTPMTTKAEPFGEDLKALHTYGRSFTTKWVTIHDTATDGNEPFCSTTAASDANATAFKRPENGVFRPGSGFGEFYFTETGDTNADSPANEAHGGWGGVFKLSQSSPSADTGRITVSFLGDKAHTGFDNLAFATDDQLMVVEDAGDTLHTQRNALDSGYVYDVRDAKPTPVRFLAEGRDPSATIDSAMTDAGTPGFDNDGDNEITGIHVSDGDPTTRGLLGREVPTPFEDGWRMFWTQQHGDNTTFELLSDR